MMSGTAYTRQGRGRLGILVLVTQGRRRRHAGAGLLIVEYMAREERDANLMRARQQWGRTEKMEKSSASEEMRFFFPRLRLRHWIFAVWRFRVAGTRYGHGWLCNRFISNV